VYVRMTDPDAPTLKRSHSDSSSSTLHDPTHFERGHLVQRSSSRPYFYHGLPQPPPSHHIVEQGQLTRNQAPYPGFEPSPSLLPSDIRAHSDPRTIPLHRKHPNSVAAAPHVSINKDTISKYPSLLTPQSISASDASTSLLAIISVNTDVKLQPSSEGMEYEDGYQSPSSVTLQHRPNGSVTNGYSHTTIPHNDQGFHHPPLPGQQYGQSISSHASKPYTTQHPGSAAQGVRRKQVRATQACNHCRTRKQKCDEARPCQFCRENSFDCQYKDVPPPK
jgi:hypothetical protein